MQYKIPVQVENEDPILLGLSLRQLAIIMVWFWIAYSVFKNLAPEFWNEVALAPSWIIAIIAIVVATFRQYEMTFIPFILSFMRYNINPKERSWQMWVDSFQPMKIGYLESYVKNTDDEVDVSDKMEKMNELKDKLKDI